MILKRNPNSMQIHFMKMIFFFASLFIHLQICSSAVLAPVRHDRKTGLYSLSICTKTPRQDANLILDLSSSYNWVDCSHNYTSSTYHSIPCTSSLCNSFGSHVCSQDCSVIQLPAGGCSKNSCFLSLVNSGTRKRAATKALALLDSLALPVTDGRNPGPLRTVPEFVFSCSSKPFFRGHRPKGTTGLAGLGQSNFSLIGQLSTRLSLPSVFTMCLSGSPSAPGVVFWGTFGPYYFHPLVDLSKNLFYTPLLITNPATESTLRHLSDEYFIGLTAIKVNNFTINMTNNFGRAILSTTLPYTTLHSSIYKPMVDAFLHESAALNLSLSQPVRPFSVCFDSENVSISRLGPLVPTIDFVMQSPDVFWRVHGSNSMVRILNYKGGVDVWCLAFVDGGTKPRSAPVMIGGHQMVDHLLQFDLDSKKLGFSHSVLVHNTMCANFNFTVNHNLS